MGNMRQQKTKIKNTDDLLVPSTQVRLHSLSEDELTSLLRTEYDLADEFRRVVREFNAESSIPAMNELRYAGFHFLYAETNGAKGRKGELIKAINHCRRASYEAAESGILTALDTINLFRGDYKTITISPVFPNWHEALKTREIATASLSKARARGPEVNGDHEEFKAIFNQLKSICEKLDLSREELNKIISVQRSDTRKYIVTVVLSFLSVLVAAIGIFWSFHNT